ncbi:MAG TPA: glycoside hydrolase family 31 protein [Chitinophagales bacterium]|nr:glycoside hydrolase family 31 protein [Chitinophagales bacterium]HRK27017.1 glycoside hydrolase family 31 protein [Chitinophagales bacterium]
MQVHQDFFPDVVKKWVKDGDKVCFHAHNKVVLCVQVITDRIIRFRYNTDGHFERDFSYAIDEKFLGNFGKFEFKEQPDYFTLSTQKLVCKITKLHLTVSITDDKGNMLCEDEKGFHWEEHAKHGGNIVKMTKKVQEGEFYYGLGDKPTHLNLRGKRLRLWGTDVYGFDKQTDPIYKNIPFYMGLHHNRGYGIFFDNTFQSHFDFASERRSVTSFWAHGGEMNYYFIYGPDLIQVVEQYTRLTGKPELPPLWALGYHQCKWSYYPDTVVKEIAAEFRKRKIPCDAIYLDIDYMDGFRCFTWHPERFPEPKKMVEELAHDGFKTIVIIDPGIKVDEDYRVCREGFENGYFCRRADGPLFKGKVWPDDCYFPDFTNPKVREWWAGLFKEMIAEIGVKGVWNDMNEPAVFEVDSKTFPDDVRHYYEGNYCSHRKAHNIYGMQMARATYEGIKKAAYPERPFVITRSAYSGTQRFSSVWTGDNKATWEHLWIANVQCQRLAISGISFAGSDIGGFIEHPSAELYVRWIQLGVFHPFCRTHSSGDHGVQEPWSFGPEATAIVKKFIELRYQLLPYLYTTFWQYVSGGTPMLRPLAFIDQQDADTLYRTDEFTLGDNLLICPILEPNVQGRRLYLPSGNWYNFWTDELIKGGSERWVAAPLEITPLFVREGAVIPMYPLMQYVGEKPVEELTLHVYYKNGEHDSHLFEDAGNGYGYKNQDYSEKQFTLLGTPKVMTVIQTQKGRFETPYNQCKMVIHGLPFAITTCKIDKEPIDLNKVVYNEQTKTYTIRVNSNFAEVYCRTDL